jgi:hypothetical protein
MTYARSQLAGCRTLIKNQLLSGIFFEFPEHTKSRLKGEKSDFEDEFAFLFILTKAESAPEPRLLLLGAKSQRRGGL